MILPVIKIEEITLRVIFNIHRGLPFNFTDTISSGAFLEEVKRDI